MFWNFKFEVWFEFDYWFDDEIFSSLKSISNFCKGKSINIMLKKKNFLLALRLFINFVTLKSGKKKFLGITMS